MNDTQLVYKTCCKVSAYNQAEQNPCCVRISANVKIFDFLKIVPRI